MSLSISHVFFCSSFAVILEKQIRIPRSLSVKAASVLKGFLNKVKQTRQINVNVFVTWTCYSAVLIIVFLLYFLTSVLPFSFTLHLSTFFICFCLSVHCFFLWIFFSLFLQEPKERLGCHPQTGFADIMGHPFFRNVDWDLVSHCYLFPLSE